MLISIFAATLRPQNIIGFLDNLKATAEDYQSFEVLIKIDEGAEKLKDILENYQVSCPFTIKYLMLPKLDGYYSLDVGYNELLKISNPKSYFCWLLTDEIRIETKGWDTKLKKYLHYFNDDIFRIKLSIFQSKNYNDFFECLPCPDNYAITTRKWLTLTEGWGYFWGPDSWHQCIDYFLGLSKNPLYPFGIWRSFAVFDINIAGQEAGLGIEDKEKLKERRHKIWYGWLKHSSHLAQENYYKLALRLNLHIYAVSKSLKEYIILENATQKTISLHACDNHPAELSLSYKIPKVKLKIFVGHKKIHPGHICPKLFLYRGEVYSKLVRLLRFLKINYIKKLLLVIKKGLIEISKPFMQKSHAIQKFYYNGKTFERS